MLIWLVVGWLVVGVPLGAVQPARLLTLQAEIDDYRLRKQAVKRHAHYPRTNNNASMCNLLFKCSMQKAHACRQSGTMHVLKA